MVDMSKRLVIILVLIFTLPMIGINNNSIVTNASAADSCSGDIEPIVWNQTLGRSALVPHYNYYSGYFGFGDYYDEDYDLGLLGHVLFLGDSPRCYAYMRNSASGRASLI